MNLHLRLVFALLCASAACVEAPDEVCPTCGEPADVGLASDSGADAGDTVVNSCRIHADCPNGYCAEHRCVDCVSDEHCGFGNICVGLSCRQGCRGDHRIGCAQAEDCPGTCSAAAPVCADRNAGGGQCRECVDDQHCRTYGLGNTCVDNRCTNTCGPNNPCAEGICDEATGICVACLEDAQCGSASLICSDRQCVPGCRADASCGAGQICVNEQCTSGCRGQTGCPSEHLCVEGQCQRGDCLSGADCGPGQRCVNNFCGNPCGVDGDCGTGAICVDNNCQPGCHGDDDVVTCGDGAFCRDRQCVRGCPDDAACADGEVCLETQCVPGCRVDAQCADGLRCIQNQCARGCAEDAHCFAGQRCVENQCRQQCVRDDSCGQGQICEGGLCAAGCRNDATCGHNARCEAGQCVAGCRDAQSCNQGETCFDNDCVPSCYANGAGCPNGYVCNREQRACVRCLSNADCGDPLVCDTNTHSCVLRCQRSSDCPGGAICSGNHCVPCRNDAQCSNGLVCDPNSGCVECLTNAHCDRGEVCDPIRRRCTEPGLNGVCQPDASTGGCTRNGDRDCQDDLRCYRIDNGRDIRSSYCLQPCEENADCPRGFYCLDQGACFPFSSRQRLTCEAYAELGTRCNNSSQCGNNQVPDDAICSGYGRYSNPPRCSWFCASNTDCPADHVCEDPPPANGSDPLPRCTPAP